MSAMPHNNPGHWEEARVMMVDDESLLTDVIQTHLEDAGYTRFIACNEPREALDIIRSHRPDVLLLDLMMPEVSGFDILEAMRKDEALTFLPVIVLTAASDPATKLQALEMGATEFLSKPVDASELILRVRNTLAFKQYQDRLAYVDPVTNLSNRQRFNHRLDDAIAKGLQQESTVGLLHISCDQFRETRETLGVHAADALLRQAAHRLVELVAPKADPSMMSLHTDSMDLARIGDQDFALILPDLPEAETAAEMAKQVLLLLNRPIEVDGHSIFLTPGIGISLTPTDGQHAEALLKSADIACAKARRSSNKTRYEFFSEELTARSVERLTLANQLRRAIEQNELRLYYQPKVCMRTGTITGAEALVRWEHPEQGLLLPGRFIAVAEETGLIGDISEWVMREACFQIAQWRSLGHVDLKVSINVAKPHFEEGHLCPRLEQLLQDTGIPAQSLMVELTESMLVQDAARALQQMNDLRALGVGLSIDDFGTGYSSLSYLKRFPANELKIDRSFVIDVATHDKDRAIVQTVVTLGHSLGMDVVAEGVETVEQHRMLQHVGCDVYQGFLFSKAVPPAAFEALVSRNRRPPGVTSHAPTDWTALDQAPSATQST
ncbi:MAG TPA: EAL domain-containing protein [Aquabacterium sp.]|uniref:putative bifunctional diguanylate cyclase/phosphodiesterase n=1 Tax=Aquabacterium sp. TaxID=1872578 RepID=UPI002E3475D1|nr:EAL domain-containing protein [Aquabacterium sp.]HEX5372254.1 EAL domain-containing protein [Aquabacterium sp.]